MRCRILPMSIPMTGLIWRNRYFLTTYARMTRAQAIRNADSYAQFAREIYTGGAETAVVLGLSPGAMLSTGRPRFAITASMDFRSRSGIEVFDLIGGIHAFISLDLGGRPRPADGARFGPDCGFWCPFPFGADPLFRRYQDWGVWERRSRHLRPQRNVVGVDGENPAGLADFKFRAGVDLRLLYDFLHGNNAVIFGGEFSWGP